MKDDNVGVALCYLGTTQSLSLPRSLCDLYLSLKGFYWGNVVSNGDSQYPLCCHGNVKRADTFEPFPTIKLVYYIMCIN